MKTSKMVLFMLSLVMVACSREVATETIESAAAPVELPTLTAIVVAESTEMPSPTPVDLLAAGRDAANLGMWEEAISFFDQAIAIEEDAQAYVFRGNAYLAMKELDAAIGDFNVAISLDAENASAYYTRGLAYAQKGVFGQAISDYGKATEIEASFALAYRNRAEALIIEGKYEAAILDLQLYLSLVPKAADKKQVRAQIRELQGEGQEVINEEGLLFFDDFSSKESGWFSNGDPALISEYDEGGYRLKHPQAKAAGWALAGRLFTDVRIEVQTIKQGGVDDNFFGLMCRVQGTTGSANFYIFMISSDGYYGIGKRVEGGELELIGSQKMQASSAIRRGEESNTIKVECEGERLALYVNDIFVAEAFDSELSTGQVALAVGNLETGGVNILFDDLAVYALTAAE